MRGTVMISWKFISTHSEARRLSDNNKKRRVPSFIEHGLAHPPTHIKVADAQAYPPYENLIPWFFSRWALVGEVVRCNVAMVHSHA